MAAIMSGHSVARSQRHRSTVLAAAAFMLYSPDLGLATTSRS
jgi:hypothetical protein